MRAALRPFSLIAQMALIYALAAGAGHPLKADEDQEDKGGIPDPSIATSLPDNGDPGGYRAALAKRGVTYGFNYIGETLGNPIGGQSQGVIYEGLAEGVVDVDLGKLLGYEGLTFHINAYQIHGRGLSEAHLDNLNVASGIEALASTRLDELWLEQTFLNDKAALRVGQLAADSEYFLSTYAGLFINSAFGWPTLPAEDLPGGGPAYPLAAPGARLKLTPRPDTTILAAVFSGDPGGPGSDPDAQRRNRNGVNFGFVDEPLVIAEGQYRYNQEKNAGGLPGEIKIGGWRHFGRFEDQLTGDPLHTNFSLYAVLDQLIYALPGQENSGEPLEDRKGIGFFLRITGAPSDRNLIDFYIDTGLNFSGFVPGRSDDSFGIAFAYANISDDVAEADILAGDPARDFEAVLEITYSAQILPGWTLQPEFQYIWHPGGNVLTDDGSRAGNAVVLGLRTVINY
jgi:porin